ncbi:MAG: hypothetical protein ACI83P_002555 [Janthinobacterium sp.]|jgi:hypothetical protein
MFKQVLDDRIDCAARHRLGLPPIGMNSGAFFSGAGQGDNLSSRP